MSAKFPRGGGGGVGAGPFLAQSLYIKVNGNSNEISILFSNTWVKVFRIIPEF